jgi:type I restriction enzyme S subunit
MSVKKYRIGEFLTRSKESVRINKADTYSLVTIKMYHKGVTKRSEVKGDAIKSSTLYKIKEGQFILSGIDARNGAFGIVPKELNGAVITNDFWTHDINTSVIDIDFFYWFTTTPQFYQACIKASEGTTNRQRLQAEKFYGFEVMLPSIDKQKSWVNKFVSLKEKYDQLNKELKQQQTYLQLLHKCILQKAVQGKLTEQNTTDEKAIDLLKRIKSEKECLVKAGKFKKEKDLPPITKEEIPFELPKDWTWCRLGEICIKIGSGSTPRGGKDVYKSEGVKFIRSQNVYNEGLLFENVVYIDRVTHEKMRATRVIDSDILLNITGGSIGRCALVNEGFGEANVNQHVTIIRTVSLIVREYIHALIISPYFQDYIMATQTGGNREGLAKKNLELMLIPLPPIAEQQRVIVKVKRLQQQLKVLEAQVNQSLQYAQKLLQSVLIEVFVEREYLSNKLVSYQS